MHTNRPPVPPDGSPKKPPVRSRPVPPDGSPKKPPVRSRLARRGRALLSSALRGAAYATGAGLVGLAFWAIEQQL
ncbi:hypothetical protein RB625_32770 [Streptomyces californicus]|uniref:hypothetical protein n=1 Tax=Streptomyces californicus TaxID=67351 RepID=UPI00296F9CF6|nr:hypothetical protein [Streptomyces californicus]MDW4903188.1 hypothetical protein [Streptomyces californicus]